MAGQPEQAPSVAGCTGNPAMRQAASLSPIRPRRWVTFEDSSPRRDTEVKQASPTTTSGMQNLDATGSQLLP